MTTATSYAALGVLTVAAVVATMICALDPGAAESRAEGAAPSSSPPRVASEEAPQRARVHETPCAEMRLVYDLRLARSSTVTPVRPGSALSTARRSTDLSATLVVDVLDGGALLGLSLEKPGEDADRALVKVAGDAIAFSFPAAMPDAKRERLRDVWTTLRFVLRAGDAWSVEQADVHGLAQVDYRAQEAAGERRVVRRRSSYRPLREHVVATFTSSGQAEASVHAEAPLPRSVHVEETLGVVIDKLGLRAEHVVVADLTLRAQEPAAPALAEDACEAAGADERPWRHELAAIELPVVIDALAREVARCEPGSQELAELAQLLPEMIFHAPERAGEITALLRSGRAGVEIATFLLSALVRVGDATCQSALLELLADGRDVVPALFELAEPGEKVLAAVARLCTEDATGGRASALHLLGAFASRRTASGHTPSADRAWEALVALGDAAGGDRAAWQAALATSGRPEAAALAKR